MEENPELKIVLKKMKSIIDKNEETSKILEKSKQDLKESKDRCSEDLKNFYLVTIKKLEEAYEETRDLVDQEHDKLRGKLEEREKMIHKCTYALLPQIMKLAGSKVTEIFLNESKDVLAANQEAIDISKAFQSLIFNFIPNSKLRKPKLGYLQLCNSLPSDFKLRIMTPMNCISIGKQVNCGIVGAITTESLQHLQFGIRKETSVISSQMCVAEDKLVTFSFCPDAAGVYNIMAHLFGQPIVDSPRSVAVAPCNEKDVTASMEESKEVMDVTTSMGESKEVVICDSSTSSPRGNRLSPQKFVLKEVERLEKMTDIASEDQVCSSSNVNRTFLKCEDSVAGGGWKVGDKCIAKWDEDQIWYRAQVTEIQHDGKYFVIFVDYGNSDIVTKLVGNLADIPEADTCDENVGPSGDINGNKDEREEKRVEKQDESQDRFDVKEPKNDDKKVIKQIEKEDQKLITEEVPKNKDKQGTENKFSIGDVCVARWEDDGVWYNGKVETVNNDGSYVVEFVDYGNSEVVFASFIVETGADIPEEVKKDEIDENVNTNKVKMDDENNETSEMRSIFTPSVGEVCVARWDEDFVWYNCKVEAANDDGSFTVNFIDYGNSEMVRSPNVVKSAEDIPEGVPKENIDENVNLKGNECIVGGDENVQSVAPKVSENSIVESKILEVANDGLKTADGSKTGEVISDGLKTASGSKIEEKPIGELKIAGGSKTEEAFDALKTTSERTAGEAATDGLFSVGDVCVAKWSEDEAWYNGVVTAVESNGYVVMFSDYGNSASVQPTNVVRNASDIPKDVMDDQIDEHVKMTEADGHGHEDPAPKTALADSPPDGKIVEKQSSLFSVRESCVARWEEDEVWYNGKIMEVNQDGSFVVNFVDYGNSETIFASSIVKDGSKIPATIPKDQIDENVDRKAPEDVTDSADKASKTEVKPSSTFSSGDICVARWNEDMIWYNGKITDINTDGSFMVNFVDYGNTEVVMPSFIVQNASDIPKSVSNDEIDENVIQARNNFPSEDVVKVEEKTREIDIEEKPDKMTKTRETENIEKPDLTTKPREKSTPAVPRPLKQVQSALPKAPSKPDKWLPGDVCLAQWSEDSVWYRGVVEERNASGTYTVTFNDYGNKEEVQQECVVRDYKELRATGEDCILDVNVKVDNDREETSRDASENSSSTKALVENQVVKQSWSVGDGCIAMWSDDQVWYNSKIEQIKDDGSFKVTFVDYGNSDVVRPPFIVKDVSQISQLVPILDENLVTGKEIVQMEKAASATPTAIIPYTNAVEKAPSPTSQVEPTAVIPFTSAVSPSSRKANSPKAEMIKSLLTPEQLRIMNGTSVITSLDILKSLSDTRQLPVKKMLIISQDVKEPIGITVLQNRNIVIASTGDDSVKIFSPNGKVISTVQSGRPFKRPSDMFTLSTGDFVVRDDLGLHLFTDKGEFLRDLGKDNIDRCYGVTEDEKGRIVTMNSAKAFPNSKPGGKGKGGQTDVGETDIFFIDQKTGSVVKRIELVDIVQDKAKSKCRFLNYYKGVVFVVDLGLDCIYTINVDGNHAEMFGKSGKGPDQFLDPAGLVLDDFGNMIVADSRNHRLQIFNSKYEHVGVVKVDGPPPLKRPSGIYLDKKYRELYVLNYWGNSMVKYRIG